MNFASILQKAKVALPFLKGGSEESTIALLLVRPLYSSAPNFPCRFADYVLVNNQLMQRHGCTSGLFSRRFGLLNRPTRYLNQAMKFLLNKMLVTPLSFFIKATDNAAIGFESNLPSAIFLLFLIRKINYRFHPIPNYTIHEYENF